MTFGPDRRHVGVVTPVALLLLDLILRFVLGGPYPGATALIVAACGTMLLPLVPAELASPVPRVAVLPALGLGSFTIIVTTLSTLGVALTEGSIRLTVAILLAVCLVLATVASQASVTRRRTRRDALAVSIVIALALFSFAASWDIVGPFPPRGTDWGHYFLYADEVESHEKLLVDDTLAGRQGLIAADPAMVGALYGGMRILDGVSSRSFGAGLAIASAFSTLSVVATVSALWGLTPGIAAGALYSVAPIRMDPMYWHGLGTILALVFVPFVVLALGLMFRGRREPRTVALLAFALAAVAAAHTTTAVVVALSVAVAVVVDVARTAVARPRAARDPFLVRWWRQGAIAPLLSALVAAVVLGAGVVVHLVRQARSLGDPVDYRFFEPDWLTWGALDEYLSAEYLVLGGVSLLVVLAGRRSRRDPALLAVAALLLASVAASQLWRLEISYEYRRAVYPFGLALALLVGAAVARRARPLPVATVGLVVCLYFAHSAIGLRLPQRLLADHEPTSSAPAALDAVRSRIDRGELPDTRLVVADRCLHFIVPYLLQRPTIAAFEEWQIAFENRLPAARRAATIMAGGAEGRQAAMDLKVGYVVADPRCTPDPAPGVGGIPIVQHDDVVVLRLPPT